MEGEKQAQRGLFYICHWEVTDLVNRITEAIDETDSHLDLKMRVETKREIME